MKSIIVALLLFSLTSTNVVAGEVETLTWKTVAFFHDGMDHSPKESVNYKVLNYYPSLELICLENASRAGLPQVETNFQCWGIYKAPRKIKLLLHRFLKSTK